MNYWAMRTSRGSDEIRSFLKEELRLGRLRQGWGYDESQNLACVHELWEQRAEISAIQAEVNRHWRMYNGAGEDYMQLFDLVAIPNMPEDGLFTIVRITGDYHFDIVKQFKDYGHIRPVEVLTPKGVSNTHELVDAGLRRSFCTRSRMWNIKSYAKCLEQILNSGLEPQDLASGSRPDERVESVASALITDQIDSMACQLWEALPSKIRAAEWEPVLKSALEPLFPVSVHRTGGPLERGADIEIVIQNPFKNKEDENRDWIIPVQVKDYDDEVGVDVADQLEQAFTSRNKTNLVIAVVLLASNARASKELEEGMDQLAKKYCVPFIFGDHELFKRLLARGYLKKS